MFIEPNPFDKDMVIKKDQNCLNESVRNILLTKKGERPFEPDFGTRILNTVFETPQFLEIYCDGEISYSLNSNEPRVFDSTRTYNFSSEKIANITIEYFLAELLIQQKTSITLERV